MRKKRMHLFWLITLVILCIPGICLGGGITDDPNIKKTSSIFTYNGFERPVYIYADQFNFFIFDGEIHITIFLNNSTQTFDEGLDISIPPTVATYPVTSIAPYACILLNPSETYILFLDTQLNDIAYNAFADINIEYIVTLDNYKPGKCYVNDACQLVDQNDYAYITAKNVMTQERTQLVSAVTDTANTLNPQTQVGDIVTFGTYPQNPNSNERQPIEWFVINLWPSDDGTVTYAELLSCSCLEAKQFNEQFVKTSWEQCSLREWLNSDFLLSAFSTEEQERMSIYQHSTGTDYDYSDKVYLPEELYQNWLPLSKQSLFLSLSTSNQEDEVSSININDGWWLMDSGKTPSRAKYMSNRANEVYQAEVDSYAGVRPVIMVELQ